VSAYVLCTGRGGGGGVVERIRNLRAPIPFTIAGQEIELLTIGHVAKSLGQTPWTIRHWQRKGLFPETPFHIHPAVPNLRRHLFPKQFVDALADIALQNQLAERPEREEWQGFRDRVLEAYRRTVVPLLGGVADVPKGSIGPLPTLMGRESAGIKARQPNPRTGH
jgi:hypothetical protein